MPGQESKSSVNGERLIDAFRNLKTGRVTKPYFTSKMRELLKEHGIDPYQEWRPEEKRDNVVWLIGEEAWIDYTAGWEQNKKNTEELWFSKVDPEVSSEGSVSFLSLSGEPATTEFVVSSIANPPANGSVTVKYLGVQVTTNYTSTWPAIAVANTISHNINTHPSIQLNATVNGTTVTIREKRDGCDYNGNPAYVSHTNGTHITVNNDVFYMSNGHDGEGWCEPTGGEVPPPPTTINVLAGSFVNTNQYTGQVAMASETIASQNIHAICVVSRSYEDGWQIDDIGYCENGDNYVLAGVGTTKDPQAPSVLWQQFGEHLWHINPDDTIAWYTTSYAWKNF